MRSRPTLWRTPCGSGRVRRSTSPGWSAGEPEMGDWSTQTASSRSAVAFSALSSEDLPDPATPVTAVRTPVGRSTSIPARLFSSAPRISNHPDGSRGSSLSSTPSARLSPVRVPAPRSLSTLPSNTTWPPSVPAPGPISMTWSAISIVCGRCSTTSTVLPLSRSASNRSLSRSISAACRPAVGSSNTYVTSDSAEPKWRIIFTRCASPPESVELGRSSAI